MNMQLQPVSASSYSNHTEVDMFVGNHTDIDPEIFQLWVEGNSYQEATVVLQQRGALQVFPGSTIDLLLADVLDHYRTYGALEKLLQCPGRIYDQWIFQMLPGVQQTVIKMYYDFDGCVMRELIGKKLSARHRKDLDEISQSTGINLKSCRRQFDNVKRITKAIEEFPPGPVCHHIKENFCLPDDLIKKYLAVIFITANRFETSKRKLQYLTFLDFFNCAHSMMNHWTQTGLDDENEGGNVEFDREFLMDLRDLRVIIEKEKEHKNAVCKSLKGKVLDRIYLEVEHNFKVYSRTLINIAYGLNHSKELRDLFVDLIEKFVDPCKHLHWPPSELKIFLNTYNECALQLENLKSQPTLKAAWKRYMDGLTGCIVAMYHN